MILSLAAEQGMRREAKRRWSETVWWSDSQQLSSGKLKNESRDTDSIWQNKDRDRRMERQKWRGQREEETTLGIVGLKPERGGGELKQHSERNDWVKARAQTELLRPCHPQNRASYTQVTPPPKKSLYFTAHGLSRATQGYVCVNNYRLLKLSAYCYLTRRGRGGGGGSRSGRKRFAFKTHRKSIKSFI